MESNDRTGPGIPVTVAIIGLTNEGKTSVMRTFAEDPGFGRVDSRTGTTARSEVYSVTSDGGEEILRFVDTPGFQMPGMILELLEDKFPETAINSLGVEDVLSVVPEGGGFSHDLRSWKTIGTSDVLIYVINAGESPGNSLHRSALTLLWAVHKPLVVVFNNVAGEGAGMPGGGPGAGEECKAESDGLAESPRGTEVPGIQGTLGKEAPVGAKGNPTQTALPIKSHYQREWIGILRERGFFLYQVYDAHRRDFDNEYELLGKICQLIPDPEAAARVRGEMAERLARERRRFELSRNAIARFLVDLAMVRICADNVSQSELDAKKKLLRSEFRRMSEIRERAVHLELLGIWGFASGLLDSGAVSFETDIGEAERMFGSGVPKNLTRGVKYGAGIGVGVGLLIDAAFAGLSLGTATALGAGLGALLGGAAAVGYSFRYDRKEKRLSASPGAGLFYPLAARSVELVRKLSRRGQAQADCIKISIFKPASGLDLHETVSVLRELARIDVKRLPDEWERQEQARKIGALLKATLPDPGGKGF